MNKDNASYQAAVIGLGNIGAGYDKDIDAPDIILTHTKAYLHHPGFQLVAGVDNNLQVSQYFSSHYQLPCYNNIADLFGSHSPKIISLCTPTADHYFSFLKLMDHKPKIVICEKPFASSFKQAQEMVKIANENECYLLVNYMRRFEPSLLALKKQIKEGIIGDIVYGEVVYTKSIDAYASHYIDLCCFLFDCLPQVTYLHTKKSNSDFILKCKNSEIFFKYLNLAYSHLTLTLYGTLGRIEYLENGNKIIISNLKSHPLFEKVDILCPQPQIITKLSMYQYYVLEHVINLLNNSTFDIHWNSLALTTQNIIEEITVNYRD